MSWSYRILSSSHKARQFEYRPNSNDNDSEILFGTLCGKLYSVKLPSLDNKDVVNDNDNDIYIPRYLGQFGKNDDAILGICWLRKQCNRYVVGSSRGYIHCGNTDSYNNNNSNSNIIQEYQQFSKLTSIHLNADDNYMLVSGYSNNANIYDLNTGKIIQEYNDVHSYHINISRFSNRSPHVFATSSFDKSIKLWDLRMKPNTPMYTRECSSGIVMISFSPDDSFVLASGLDNEIQQFRTLDGRSHTTFQIPKTGLDGNFTRAYYSSSGEYIVTGACEESNVSILSSVTGEMVGRDQVYPNRKHHSLYIQSLRGSPYSDNSICVLANYRELGDRELIMVSIPSPDNDSDIDKIVMKSDVSSYDANRSPYAELPSPLNSTLCLPSFGISLEMNSLLNSCPLIHFSYESLICSNNELCCDLYVIDSDIIEETGVDLLMISRDNDTKCQQNQTIALSAHSFAMLARSYILRQRINIAMKYPIDKETGLLRVIDVSDIIPPNCGYLLPLLLKYLYAGDNFINMDNIKRYCLDNVTSKCTQSDMIEKVKLLNYSNFKELPISSSCWRNVPLCRLYVATLGHFMALADAWELNHLQALIDNLLCQSILNTTCIDILHIAEEYGRVAVRIKVMYHISLYIDYIPLLPPPQSKSNTKEDENVENINDSNVNDFLHLNPNLSKCLSPLVISQLVDIRKSCRVNVCDREPTVPLFRHQMSTESNRIDFASEGADELYSLHALKSTHCKSMIIPKFWGHSMTKARGNNLLVIGGRDKLKEFRGSSLYSFNTRSNDWSLLNAAGDSIPPMMVYHVSLPLQKHNSRHIVTIGGSRHPNTFPDDNDGSIGNVVNVLDTMTMSWSAPHVQFKQQKDRKFEIYDRTRHSVVAIYKEDLINGRAHSNVESDNTMWTLVDNTNKSSTDMTNDILSTVRANLDHIYLSNQDTPQYSEHLKKRKQKQFTKVQKLYDTLCLGSSGLLTPPCTNDNNNENEDIKPTDLCSTLNSNLNLSYVEPVAWFIFFGGFCDADESVKNDVHLLTCNARYYRQDITGKGKGDPEYEWEWLRPNIRAVREIPGHRLGHAAVCINSTSNEGGNRMIIYGGFGGMEPFDNVCSLRCNDESNMIWEAVDIKGQSPGGRYGHTMISLPESNLIIMFGGKKSFTHNLRPMNDVWLLRILESNRDVNIGISLQWEHVIFKGVPPSPRFEHRACEINGNMYIMGGMNITEGENPLRDLTEAEAKVHVLDTSSWEWITPTCSYVGAPEEPIISTSYCTLHSDLLKLLYHTQCSSDHDADISFNCQTIDDNSNDIQLCQFRAHSPLLKARSSFVKAMLEANMKEASSKQVTIHCLESSVFYSLLIYLYTDTLRVQPDDSTLLLELANQYQIKRLETLIEGYLSKQVNLTNIIDLLGLSDMFGLEELKLTCFSLLLQNEKNDSILMKEIKKTLSSNEIDTNNNDDNNKGDGVSLSSSIISEYNKFRKEARHAYMMDTNDNVHRLSA